MMSPLSDLPGTAVAYSTAVPDSGQRFAAFLAMGALLLGFGTALGLLLSFALSLWHGQRLRMHATPIRDLSGATGPIYATGIVQPAWTVLAPPMDDQDAVYYSTNVVVPRILRGPAGLDQRNSVPFVLADRSGRVLVLARHAKWLAEPEPVRSVTEEEWAEDISRREARGVAEPECLAIRNVRYTEGMSGKRKLTERAVHVGDTVTVWGCSRSFKDTAAKDRDACADEGTRLGLDGDLVLTADGRQNLVIMPGTPDQNASRVRDGALKCLILAPLAVFGGLAAFVFLLPFTAYHP